MIIKKLNLLYVKMMFLSAALIDVNDELEGTNVYRQRVKFLSKELGKELEKVTGGMDKVYEQDELSSHHAYKAISDIAESISQMTLNDWLHMRNWLGEYLKRPDSVRILNKAQIKTFEKYELKEDIEINEPNN